jgi:RNA polymerase sigma-70 factor, ECF subfamily
MLDEMKMARSIRARFASSPIEAVMSEDGAVHEELRAWLRRLASALFDDRLRGKVEPSDVVQDALLKAHEHREQLRGKTDGERRAWLRQILANTLADLVRRYLVGRKRNVGREQSLDAAVEQSSAWFANGPPPDEAAANNERLLWLAEALMTLPDDQRQAVQLKHLHGFAVGAVAQQMGRTAAAVAGLLRRGLETLRQHPGA